MRILVTADLHYNIARSKASTLQLAQDACRHGGDALLLLGDTAGADLRPFAQALDLFRDFPGRKLLVPGNHCIWCQGLEDSIDRYRRILPQLAHEHGFELLDHQPVILGDVGLVGSIGWYDYTFRDPTLNLPLGFYRAKISPGAAQYLGRQDILDAHANELLPGQGEFFVRWMDGQFVRLGMTDEEFTSQLAQTLQRQLEELSPKVQRIVVGMHHLPFGQLVPRGRPDKFAFAAAYMGAAVFGQVLMKFPKVTHVYCGHSHWPHQLVLDGKTVVSIGSTYIHKHLEIVEFPPPASPTEDCIPGDPAGTI